MAEMITDEEESKLKIRLKSQRHVRALLIIVNLLLVFYIIYFIGDLVAEKVNNKDADIVSLDDLSRGKSKNRYEELMNGRQKIIGDYMVYGTSLHLSEEKLSLPNYTPMSNIYLLRTSDGALINTEIDVEVNEGIDLKYLEEGDYLLAIGTSQEKEVIKIILGKERYEETIYSLPLYQNSRLRKKISLYAYPHNPAFVIKVRDVYEIDKDYYDLVVQGNEENRHSFIETINNDDKLNKLNLKIKEIDADKTLLDAYITQATTAIELVNNETSYIVNSHYVKSDFIKDNIFDDGSLKGYDQNNFIRELGGYAFQSGSRQKDIASSFEVTQGLGVHDAGKMALSINSKDQNDLKTQVLAAMNFLIKNR